MNKFKVGDRVRYVGSESNVITKGAIVTVTKFDGSEIPYRVEDENKRWTWVYAEDIEAIKAPATTEQSYIVDTTSPIKVGDKIRILVDGYNCIQKSKVGHIFVIVAVDKYTIDATCDQIKERDDVVWSITPRDRGTGWELVREVSENYQKLAELMATLGVPADAAPAKHSRRLKYGRRRMSFEFAKALLSNPVIELADLNTPEAIAALALVADSIALELIKRWKEAE